MPRKTKGTVAATVAQPVRLNLGAGSVPVPGYKPLDIKTGDCIYPLKYADGSVDEVRASHVLEHFGMADSLNVLQDWARVLKPGGVLKIAVPNFDWVVQHYYDAVPYPMEGYVVGGQTDKDDWHHSLWTERKLSKYLTTVGLVDVQPWVSEAKDCATLAVSLNLQARKPMDGEAVPVVQSFDVGKANVAVCISLPRLCFSDFAMSMAAAFQGMNAHFWQGSGAFWGQKLENVMLRALARKPDFLFALDYDTVFDGTQVRQLIGLMVANPKVDAIAPVQQGRARDQALFTIRDEQGKLTPFIKAGELNKALMPISSAHFGLTIFRPSAFEDLPHPWFKEMPGNNGYWDESRTDADIYFWRHWRNNKRTLCLAPKVVVGHQELLIAWPNDSMSGPRYQQPSEWLENGQPAGTWGMPNASANPAGVPRNPSGVGDTPGGHGGE